MSSLLSGQEITQTRLLPEDGTANAEFGNSVGIYGDNIIVGAWQEDANGSFAGAAYIFERSAGESWFQNARLTASDGEANDYFGSDAAIFGEAAIVGAYRDDELGEDAGAAYIFVREDGTWIEDAKLLPNDGEALDLFGIAVDLQEEYAIIGAIIDLSTGRGKAYVFQRFGSSWNQRSLLTAGDGDDGDQFGNAVAIGADHAIVGSWHDTIEGQAWQGSIYMFERTNLGGWVEMQKLTAADGDDHDLFGAAVDIAGDFAVVGAPADEPGGLASGSAYVFHLADDNWTQVKKLVPPDTEPAGDKFGSAVAIDGLTIAVGAPEDAESGVSSGAVYIYRGLESSPSVWNLYQEVVPAEVDELDRVGFAVAVSGARIAAGAPHDAAQGNMSGAAYVLADQDLLSVPGDPQPSPAGFRLSENYPNPFNPATTVEFGLRNAARVSLKIYDVSGRVVKTLVDERMVAGSHRVQWDGTNGDGEQVASGIYLYRMRAAAFRQTRRMLLMR